MVILQFQQVQTKHLQVWLANNDFTVSIMATGSGGTGVVGDVLNLSGSNGEGDTIFNLTGSATGKTLNLDFGAKTLQLTQLKF